MTKQEERELLKEIREDLKINPFFTVIGLGEYYGVSEYVIRRILRKYNINLKELQNEFIIDEFRKDPYVLHTDVQKMFNVSCKRLRPLKNRILQARIETIEKHLSEGMDVKAIAHYYGVARKTIYALLKKMQANKDKK